MKKRTLFRCISLSMLVIAAIFVACALANPALGRTIYIGDIALGVEVWHAFYALYVSVMIGCFLYSFRFDKH